MQEKEKKKSKWINLLNGRYNIMGIASPQYVAFCILLVIIYITHNNYVERDLNRVSKLKTEIKGLRYQSITLSSELMNMSKQSEVARRVNAEGLQLHELTEPPRIVSK